MRAENENIRDNAKKKIRLAVTTHSLCYLIPRIIREERSFRRIEAQLDPVLFDESLRKLYHVLTFFIMLKIPP